MNYRKMVDADTFSAMIGMEIDVDCKDSTYYALRMTQEMIEGMAEYIPDAPACPDDHPAPPGKQCRKERQCRKIQVEIEAEDVDDLRVQLMELMDYTDNPEFWRRYNSGTCFEYHSEDGVYYDLEEKGEPG